MSIKQVILNMEQGPLKIISRALSHVVKSEKPLTYLKVNNSASAFFPGRPLASSSAA
jgi:hypothetical protein